MQVKVFPFIVSLSIFFLLLWSRLFQLQLIQGAENRQLSQENRIKLTKIPANRGVIYDRQGEILVRNRPEGREYIYGQVLAHVLGYIGESSELELEDYQLGDLVGKMGIEKYYDRLLRGQDGGVIVETDAQGEIVRELKEIESQPGKSLDLSLDLGLQKKIYQLLEEEGVAGAIIASQPATGEILALVSYPSFDPNIFTLKDKENKLNQVLNNASQPMFNRAIAGLYPPGSTFKIVTALAGLEEGKIDAETLVEDTGEIKIERYGQKYTYANWYYTQYGRKEGMVDIIKAIQRSNDIYFYKAGEWLGISSLADWAKYLGAGAVLGIDLPGEASGLVPTPEWKKFNKTESWYLGDTYITAIGQGNLLLTPLQVHQLSSVVAAEGQFCQPHLIKEGNFCQKLEIKKENLALVKEGMKRACEEKGTAPILADFKPQVACKTGSAEFGDPQDRTHAWFTVFAPVDNPEIVMTVLLEKAGEGSKVAAPLAKEILEYWFKKE
jgi:penicillin-binding protein 2